MTRLEQMLSFVEQDPDDSFARYAAALELSSTGETDRAIEFLQELRRRDPSYLAAYYQLGTLLADKGDAVAAADAFRTGLALAREQGERRTASELEAALDELADEL